MLIRFNGQPIVRVKLANSFQSRLVGLLNKNGLPEGEGLLLTPCNSIHTIFMRFCLDLVFLDRERKILKIVENVRPFRLITPVANCFQVLELAAGSCRKLELKQGMVLDYN